MAAFILEGNLIQLAKKGFFEVVIHGCNCQHVMGAGIAKQVKREFPEAFLADINAKLGSYTFATVGEGSTIIVNAYTQQYYGRGVQVDYLALRSCFRQLARDFTGKSMAYPKIGAGLAGGDWIVIYEIIKEELLNEDHTLVQLG